MGNNSIYMNNFTISTQKFTCMLHAQSVAPNVERSKFGPVFDEHKTIDEAFIFIPAEVAKELAISILMIMDANEKNTGNKFLLKEDKQAMWEAAVNAIAELRANMPAGDQPGYEPPKPNES